LADHIKAHELLFEIYENPRDFGAIQLLNGNFSEATKTWRQLGAQASHAIQKKNSATVLEFRFSNRNGPSLDQWKDQTQDKDEAWAEKRVE